MSAISAIPENLPARLFAKRWFAGSWAVFLAIVVTSCWHLRDPVLVRLMYGRAAQIRGVGILPGKPLRFTTGELVPQWLDAVTGFGFFFAVTAGLSLLLILGLFLYEHVRRSRDGV